MFQIDTKKMLKFLLKVMTLKEISEKTGKSVEELTDILESCDCGRGPMLSMVGCCADCLTEKQANEEIYDD